MCSFVYWSHILLLVAVPFPARGFLLGCIYPIQYWGWSGGAKVLGKLPVPGRPTILITVGQGPTALAVGAGGGCLDIFTLISLFSSLSPSLWETARYRLKYCLKGPLNPKQPTNPYSTGIFDQRPKMCEVGLLFYCDNSNVEVSSKKSDGSVCLDGKELTMLTILKGWILCYTVDPPPI